MICPKCGTELKPNVKFCKHCGTQVNINNNAQETHAEQYQYQFNYSNDEKPKYNIASLEGHEKQYDYSYNYSNQEKPDYNLNSSHQEQNEYTYSYSNFYNIPTQTTGDEKYIETFVGPNYQRFKKSKFSFGTLFFGIFYILYRKMYSLAFVYLILVIASNILLGNNSDIAVFIIKFIIAFKFNKLYMEYAERKVEQIKQSNFDKTSNELLEECRKKGGVSIEKAIILTILAMIIIPLILSIIGIIDYKSNNITTTNTQQKPEQEQEIKTSNQLKDLNYSDTNLKFQWEDEIDLQDNQFNTYHVTEKYYIHESIENCGISIKKIENYRGQSAELYLTEKTEFASRDHSLIGPINYKTPNILWKKATINRPPTNLYIYATIKDNTIYSIEASSYENENECKNSIDNFMNSTKFTD